MDRRDFLKNFLAASVVIAAPLPITKLAAAVMPEDKRKHFVLMGDGITNDSAALEAALDGETVYHKNGTLVRRGDTVYLPAGRYNVRPPLDLKGGSLQGAGVGKTIVDFNEAGWNGSH